MLLRPLSRGVVSARTEKTMLLLLPLLLSLLPLLLSLLPLLFLFERNERQPGTTTW